MKKNLLFPKIILILSFISLSSVAWSQLLYEGFNYATPAYIGGNGDAGSTSNNWTTHSVTAGQTTTENIENESLTYPGLMSSTGNKVMHFSNANATSRDINRAVTTTATSLYFSALINIIDKSQLTTNGEYFIHFGATSGAANTSFGGRCGAKLASTDANFRFVIANTSGGTVTYTDNGTDLNFGTTYLVVVKYEPTATPTMAKMWVNPTSLGGAEPTGFVSNNSGTSTFAGFGSICLRNNATTPKAYVDEIRVGETWASVTPIFVGTADNVISKHTSIYPNPCYGSFTAELPSNNNYTIVISNTQGCIINKIATSDKTTKIETTGIPSGLYFVSIQNNSDGVKEVHKLLVK